MEALLSICKYEICVCIDRTSTFKKDSSRTVTNVVRKGDRDREWNEVAAECEPKSNENFAC